MLITVRQLKTIIAEDVPKYPQTGEEEKRVLSIDWQGPDVHITLDDKDIIGQFEVAYVHLGKLTGVDTFTVKDLLSQRDEGDPDASEELIKLVYQGVKQLVDRHGPTHIYDTKSKMSELVPTEVWLKTTGIEY